ncbi:MAG: U32 family peptidase [Syntrophobacteraceae bacterium]|nr:U32 family peptidase [Syntrophobacteraceae bacterium]
MSFKPELLAPAGNVESFFAAVENGADAVYLGLKKFSARATASNFTLGELATIVPFAHKRGVRVYVALNSQIASGELAELIDALDGLASVNPDGLIVQDAGIFHLVRRRYPGLKLHASTLAAVHNSSGVRALQGMGASRVVLARELTLEEIEKISENTRAELEIFIHGALCYSYSGLCLASSFRGGRSGLRGECVQPCRLKFRQGGKEGFFLSCGDLSGLPLVPKLKRTKVAGLKIEGRMKPASWIAGVVRAYRLVLDAESAEEEKKALADARELLTLNPSRRLSSGRLGNVGASEILTPSRSGSNGLWSATVKSVSANRVLLDIRHTVAKGDRLRPESSAGKEEEAFTVSQLFDNSGTSIPAAQAGTAAYLAVSKPLKPGEKLFKLGTKSEPPTVIWKKIKDGVHSAVVRKSPPSLRREILDEYEKSDDRGVREEEKLTVKVDSPGDLVEALQSSASMVFLSATKQNLERIAKQRFSPPQMKKLGFSLQPILLEKDVEYFSAAVAWFIKKGFLLWELNNWGHFDLVGKARGLRLFAGARLNLRNGAAFAQVFEMGCESAVLSLETTRVELEQLAEQKLRSRLAVTLYCWPPLFTSCLVPPIHMDRPFLSPRKEYYYPTTKAGRAEIYADRPLSWLEQLPILRSLGYRRFVIDAGEGPAKRPGLNEVLKGFAASRTRGGYSLFNFERRPE